MMAHERISMNQIDLTGPRRGDHRRRRGGIGSCAERFVQGVAHLSAIWDMDADAITSATSPAGAASRGFVDDVTGEGAIAAAAIHAGSVRPDRHPDQ